MGRFETLKPETQDMVNAMLPAIAFSFKIDPENCKDIIPEDIRMRQWDCERRDHIKDQPEDDPRNWGVEFLKSIQAIARLNGSDLGAFQERLRELVAKHAEKHPWARLEDVRQIKNEYQNPRLRNPNGQVPESESSSDDSLDSYLEELVEQDLPKGAKRGHNEAYESRVQGWWKAAKPKKPKKPVRLRRDPDAGWDRRGKNKSKSRDVSQISVDSDAPDSVRESSPPQEPKRRRLTSKRPAVKKESPTVISDEESDDDVPVEVKKLQAELEAAEAELEVRRKKHMLLEAKAKAEAAKAARKTSVGSASVPSQIGRHSVNRYASYDSYDNGNGRNGHNNNNSGFTGFTGFGDSNDNHGFRGFNGFTGFNSNSAYPLQTNHPARQDSQGLPPPEDYEEEFDEEDFEDDEDGE
ncbi:uncharacterized protein N0V89_012280 [Didymosphaeria variabile]|uniref:Uncharacterized protein n=1 Tax=Didymosphaeria variabile TaxID=1932322 RepID=A0A9W8X8V7_9PLEO|nr:uncharacterized protein N0V89_012280 [Didymosphaeria variabile]KAJ4344537.1 hypothetical protein N0V89_012280 [Didymosphaeria variabile]